MFWRVFKTKLKVLLRNKSCLFWVLIFPFIMAILFNAAFSGLNAMKESKSSKVAVVQDALSENSEWRMFFKELDKHKSFEISFTSAEDARKKLDDGEVQSYIDFKDDKAHLFIKENNIGQTLIKNALDQYAELNTTAAAIAQTSPEYLMREDGFSKIMTEDFVKDDNTEHTDFTVNYFFTLMAMAALYASLIGIELTKNNEANLSTKGARLCVSPTNKTMVMVADLLVGFVVCSIQQLVLYFFIRFVLGVQMAAEPGWTLLISMTGVLAGLSLGIFVGASNKKSEGLKNGLLISVIMLCCFFAGMMGDPILRDKFETMMPLFAKVNPIAAIADGYYALFAYNGDMEYYWQAFARIAIFAGVMLVLSLVLSRRKRYDSI